MVAKAVDHVLDLSGGEEMGREEQEDQGQEQIAMTMAVDKLLDEVWLSVAIGLAVVLSLWASGHAVLNKRDSSAALAWVGFVWLVPLVGAVMYCVFGVNRIRHKAALLRRNLERYRAQAAQPECQPDEVQRHLPNRAGHLGMLDRVVGGVVDRPLLPGNRIDPLVNGDEAYPAMLEAIAQARRTISLVTFIFHRDEVGRAFAHALGEATRRGVEVRVLIDAVGMRHSWPTILHTLRIEGVKYARFLPPLVLWHLASVNMRIHRKIMVADGRVGFTGGMNIRLGNCLRRRPPKPEQDIHFRVQGPVVAQLQEAFTDDWLFATGEALRGDSWFPTAQSAGQVLARGVTDGPDENFERLLWTLLGAISIARYSVRIMTPYFLPDPAVVSALNLAAMRGVQVEIILPARIDLPLVLWASRAMWSQVLQHGCRLWLTPPPFDHSKLMVVDGCWVLLGSANWDARSLRLNFEFDLECYDAELAQRLEQWIETKRQGAHRVTLEESEGRPLPARLRDNIAHLMTPYL
jgi:cardiolipin synthase